MNAIKPVKGAAPSPYTSLVRSEETKHGYFETLVYALLIASAIAAILQFAMQSNFLALASFLGANQIG